MNHATQCSGCLSRRPASQKVRDRISANQISWAIIAKTKPFLTSLYWLDACRFTAMVCINANTDFLNGVARRVSCENFRIWPDALPSPQSRTNTSPPPLSASGHHESDQISLPESTRSLAITSPINRRVSAASLTDSKVYEASSGTSISAKSPLPSWKLSDTLAGSAVGDCRSS